MRKLAFAALVFNLISMSAFSGNTNDTINRSDKVTYVKMQYAGNIGLVSFGAGYDFLKSRISVDLSYGNLPKYINGVRVNIIAFKPAWHFKPLELRYFNADLYLGSSFNYSIGRNIYTKAPNYYPLDYVYPNAFSFNPLLGLRTRFKSKDYELKKMAWYVEMGTVDLKVWYAFRTREVNILKIWNLGIGFLIDIN
jgi:hypothetical protein